jgi:hypothetical protein
VKLDYRAVDELPVETDLLVGKLRRGSGDTCIFKILEKVVVYGFCKFPDGNSTPEDYRYLGGGLSGFLRVNAGDVEEVEDSYLRYFIGCHKYEMFQEITSINSVVAPQGNQHLILVWAGF